MEGDGAVIESPRQTTREPGGREVLAASAASWAMASLPGGGSGGSATGAFGVEGCMGVEARGGAGEPPLGFRTRPGGRVKWIIFGRLFRFKTSVAPVAGRLCDKS